MSSRIEITGEELVTVEEIKLFGKIEHDDEDDVLEALIASCRSEIEAVVGVALVDQTRAVSRDVLLGSVWAPLIPVTSATVRINGSEWTDFALDTRLGRLRPLTIAPLPTARADGIEVEWVYEDVAPAPALINALKELVAYRYEHRADAEAADMPSNVKAALSAFKVFRV
jgi:uncharacterized phiE125 gp8 family phage protein